MDTVFTSTHPRRAVSTCAPEHRTGTSSPTTSPPCDLTSFTALGSPMLYHGTPAIQAALPCLRPGPLVHGFHPTFGAMAERYVTRSPNFEIGVFRRRRSYSIHLGR